MLADALLSVHHVADGVAKAAALTSENGYNADLDAFAKKGGYWEVDGRHILQLSGAWWED